MVSVRALSTLFGAAAVSVSLAVKGNAPQLAGVPTIVPTESRVTPKGSDPVAMLQERGCAPPIPERVVLYAVFWVPLGIMVVVILSTFQIRSDTVWVTVTGVGQELSVTD